MAENGASGSAPQPESRTRSRTQSRERQLTAQAEITNACLETVKSYEEKRCNRTRALHLITTQLLREDYSASEESRQSTLASYIRNDKTLAERLSSPGVPEGPPIVERDQATASREQEVQEMTGNGRPSLADRPTEPERGRSLRTSMNQSRKEAEWIGHVTLGLPPSRELLAYGDYITRLFGALAEPAHTRIIEFDRAVRKRVGARRDLLLTDFGRSSSRLVPTSMLKRVAPPVVPDLPSAKGKHVVDGTPELVPAPHPTVDTDMSVPDAEPGGIPSLDVPPLSRLYAKMRDNTNRFRRVEASHGICFLDANAWSPADLSPTDLANEFATLLTGFHALLRLGELVWPDNRALRSFRKLTLRTSTALSADSYEFLLPAHKADPLFEGNHVIVHSSIATPNPLPRFSSYLTSRDRLFPVRAELWLKADGSVPTRTWFIRRLCALFPKDVAGHSMRAGGATSLAAAGVSPTAIQAVGRWSSSAWQCYIRKHPVVLHAMLFNGSDRAPKNAEDAPRGFAAGVRARLTARVSPSVFEERRRFVGFKTPRTHVPRFCLPTFPPLRFCVFFGHSPHCNVASFASALYRLYHNLPHYLSSCTYPGDRAPKNAEDAAGVRARLTARVSPSVFEERRRFVTVLGPQNFGQKTGFDRTPGP
ncbi:hypothetical protein LXA43DRAFT_1062932 [Ganoderma leucocontextum]|nr:hypothetical protein LXA43DRAFT_1062932 [Ganoderma leucocontextum]